MGSGINICSIIGIGIVVHTYSIIDVDRGVYICRIMVMSRGDHTGITGMVGRRPYGQCYRYG
jgi:hypothetical protein